MSFYWYGLIIDTVEEKKSLIVQRPAEETKYKRHALAIVVQGIEPWTYRDHQCEAGVIPLNHTTCDCLEQNLTVLNLTTTPQKINRTALVKKTPLDKTDN